VELYYTQNTKEISPISLKLLTGEALKYMVFKYVRAYLPPREAS